MGIPSEISRDVAWVFTSCFTILKSMVAFVCWGQVCSCSSYSGFPFTLDVFGGPMGTPAVKTEGPRNILKSPTENYL